MSEVTGRVLDLRVQVIYLGFRNAYAVDREGHRFLVNPSSKGVDFDKLKIDQRLKAHVNSRNFVYQVDR